MTPEEFPYITEIKVNDCYAYKDFVIPIGKGDDGKPFRHLILTGKNGSGKTTILKSLDNWLQFVIRNRPKQSEIQKIQSSTQIGSKKNGSATIIKEKNLGQTFPSFRDELSKQSNDFIYTFFDALRSIKVMVNVETVSVSKQQFRNFNSKAFTKKLKQYLVNKKVVQAFELLEKNQIEYSNTERFFDDLQEVLRTAFDDKEILLIFEQKNFEFYIQFKDGRRVTFSQLSDGFSSFLNVLVELKSRSEIIKDSLRLRENSPCGIVLIDEPETHAHIELQYQIMPLLTNIFPNIQFIVATHSPAVISSIPNAVVYDLTKQEVAKDWVVGSSYSELMVKHFGLDNEFSNVADKIIADIQGLVDDKSMKGVEKVAALKKILNEKGKYLAPSTMLEIETNILRIQEAA